MIKLIILLSLLLLVAFAWGQDAIAPIVTNVTMTQSVGIATITYDLATDVPCYVSVLISNDSGANFSITPTPATLSGAVGANVAAGTGKQIFWNTRAEATAQTGTHYRVRVMANDGYIPPVPANFALVPGGIFTMGDTRGGGFPNELPTHIVTVSTFIIGKYEVTQGEYQSIMGYNPASGFGVGVSYPGYYVNWYSALKYCNLRSMNEGLTPVYTISGSTNPNEWGAVPDWVTSATWDAVICNWNANGYRLPTEAEWEFAARSGTATPDYLYSGSDDINVVAWYETNSGSSSHPVGIKASNELGIYDISGNAWEWVWDVYDTYYDGAQTNPHGAFNGIYRVGRGGAWLYGDLDCRLVVRHRYQPYFSSYVGFRLSRAAW